MAMILSPNSGTIYDGSITFSSSKPMQIVVLHEIGQGDSKGQPVWSVDGKTTYGMSLVDLDKKSGSFEFTGAALAFHSQEPEEFTATVSLDGWIRGQPTDVVMQQIEIEKEEPSLLLSRANVAATIPLHKGLYDGQPVFYIITDSSNKELSEGISERQKWKVQTSVLLADIPETALQKIFVFTNGIQGDGINGFQDDVFSGIPSQEFVYSPLASVIEVTWKKGQNAIPLESADDVLKAHEGKRVEFDETGMVLNAPQIVWPDGQMEIRESASISDGPMYEGGQITEIDKEGMTVTFVAHRGWGPDGRTAYHIITDATPSIPAELMGVLYSPHSSNVTSDSATMDMFQFQNGIGGSGLMGFQPSVAEHVPGDRDYSPICRIHLVEWNDPQLAKILESKSDIEHFAQEGKVMTSIARYMNSEHIANCPFVDPFQ